MVRRAAGVRQDDEQIRVKVVRVKRRQFYVFRWIDPTTGKARERQSKFPAKKQMRSVAEREAARLEDELNTEYVTGGESCWHAFNQRYIRENLSGLASKTLKCWTTTVNHIEAIVQPDYVTDMDSRAIGRLIQTWRENNLSESSIKSYLSHLKAALNWGVEVGVLTKCPVIRMPRRSKGVSKQMRSRPILGEEFERMLAAVAKVRPTDSHEWERLIEGIWLSGLRLGEALELSWKWANSKFSVDMSGECPVYRIYADGEKGHRDRVLPIAPEFVTFLQQTPEAEQVGKVFPIGKALSTTGKVIGRIGKRAGVVVGRDGGTVTAHDLRRSFGTRWATRITAPELMVLMRHKSIDTTMQFYVDIDAQDLGKKLWDYVEKKNLGGALGGAALSTVK